MVIRVAGWAITFLAWAVGTSTVLAGLFGWALASGGIAITAAVPYVEQALTPADGRFEVRIGDAHLRWDGWTRTPNIRVAGVRVKGPDGEAVALPELAVTLSARALLHGTLAPTRIAVAAPRVEVVRHEDGTFGLRGIALGRPLALEEDRFTAVVQTALAALTDPSRADDPLGYLDEVRVAGGLVLFDDRITGLNLVFEDATLVLGRSPTGLSGRLDLALQQEGAAAPLRLDATYRTATDEIALDVAFEGVRPAGFAALAPAVPLDRLDLRLDGRLQAAVDAEGALSPLDFDVASGAGRVLPFEFLSHGMPVERARLRGALDVAGAAVRLDEIALAADGATLEARAVATWAEAPLEVRAEATVDRLPVSELERYWPPQLEPRARAWTLANVTGGVARDAKVTLHLTPSDLAGGRLAEDAFQGRFAFEGLTVRYLNTLPPATDIAGEGRFTPKRLDFTVAEGRVGRLRARGGSVALADIGVKDRARVVVELDAAGPIPDALALIDRPPLGFATKVGIDPAATAGEAQAGLRFEIPLVRDLHPGMVAVEATVELSRAAVQGLAAGADLTDGALRLRVDNAGLRVQGSATLAGIPTDLTWRESFTPDGPPRRYRLTGQLTAADLRALGVETDGILEGELGVTAAVTESGAGGRRADVTVDLDRAALTVPQLAWSKPEGVPGHLSFIAVPAEDGGVEIRDVLVSAPGLHAAGGGRLEADTLRPMAIDLERLLLGATATAVRWRPLAGGGHALELDAEVLDLRPLLAADGDGEPTPLELRLHADRLLLPGGNLSTVGGTLTRDATGWRSAEVSGWFATGGAMDLRLEPDDFRGRLTVGTDDAGELLRIAGVTSGIRGGSLRLDAAIGAQVPRAAGGGTLRLRDFMVTDAPPLARLLTLTSTTGIANLLSGRGIQFESLAVAFRFARGNLEIVDAQASGSQLGLTLDGSIAADGGLDLRGTIVPLYDLNRALGQVPLLGTLLAGGGDDGVFAATYWVKGTRDAPDVGVNPLAVLAPGLVRKMVQGMIDGTHEPPMIEKPRYD